MAGMTTQNLGLGVLIRALTAAYTTLVGLCQNDPAHGKDLFTLPGGPSTLRALVLS